MYIMSDTYLIDKKYRDIKILLITNDIILEPKMFNLFKYKLFNKYYKSIRKISNIIGNDFIISGSSVLKINGLLNRVVNDLDIITSKSNIDKLSLHFRKIYINKYNKIKGMELPYEKLSINGLEVDLFIEEEKNNNYVILDGYRLDSVNNVLSNKVKMNRFKDYEDIKSILEFINKPKN